MSEQNVNSVNYKRDADGVVTEVRVDLFTEKDGFVSVYLNPGEWTAVKTLIESSYDPNSEEGEEE